MDRDPSWGALLLAVLAAGLIATSFALPWWSFDSSTGRKTAPGGPQDPDETRVERHSLDYAPFQQAGDQQPSDPEGARTGILVLGVLASTALGALVLFIAFELVRFARPFSRGWSLAVATVATLAAVAGLAYTYLALPATMEGNGVEGAFTDRLLDPGYIQTVLGLGWIATAVAVPLALGALAFRFQAGSHDPTAIEVYA